MIVTRKNGIKLLINHIRSDIETLLDETAEMVVEAVRNRFDEENRGRIGVQTSADSIEGFATNWDDIQEITKNRKINPDSRDLILVDSGTLLDSIRAHGSGKSRIITVDSGFHPSGLDTRDIGLIHEEGKGVIPQRSFMSDTFRQKRSDIRTAIKNKVRRMIRDFK